MAKLEKEDLNFLKRLLDITKNILDTYNDLYHLEVNNRINSLEYDQLLAALKFYIEMENNLYQELTDLKRIYDIEDYLFDMEMPDFDTEIEYIKDNNIEMMMKIRINNRLTSLIYKLPFDEDSNLDELDSIEEYEFTEEDLEFLDRLPSPEEIEKESTNDAYLEHAVEIDILNTILAILRECLNDNKNIDIRDELLKLKYNISFVYSDIEISLVENYFNIPEILYWGSKLTLDFQKRDNESLLAIFSSYIEFVLDNQMVTMINLMEDETDLKKKRIMLTISEILFRACLLFSNTEDIKKLRTRINDEIRELELKDKFVEDFIEESFSMFKHDNGLINLVSLSPLLK